jgi:hypothetical protein
VRRDRETFLILYPDKLKLLFYRLTCAVDLRLKCSLHGPPLSKPTEYGGEYRADNRTDHAATNEL